MTQAVPPQQTTTDPAGKPIHHEILNEEQWRLVERRYHMTQRELQIARFVCTGLTNDDIAQKTDIAPGTVKTHLRNIYRKTWVSTKIAMLLRFLDEVNQNPH